MQRLGIDPLLLYGTNCVKCADVPDDARRAACPFWLIQELAIVQPKLVVVMGEEALEVVNGLGVPLQRPLDSTLGEVQSLTPTIEAVYVPAIEASLDDQAAKRAFWNAPGHRRVVRGAAAVLSGGSLVPRLRPQAPPPLTPNSPSPARAGAVATRGRGAAAPSPGRTAAPLRGSAPAPARPRRGSRPPGRA